MGEREGDQLGWPPMASPLYTQRDDRWRHFDNSVNAISFGFVATAVLISMFLVMAIFERLLRPNSPSPSLSGQRFRGDVESQMGFTGKLQFPSPKLSASAREVSVLMPGEDVPSFIAHPAPVPCPLERISWPTHQNKPLPGIKQSSDLNTTSSSI
ncbi:hypothetical protein NMG60_11012652 [Bertholletia excelsa]